MEKFLISFLAGIIGGMVIMYYMLINYLGDDFEINRPKIKGTGNKLDIFQSNKTEKKENIFKRIFTKLKKKKDE